MSLSNLPNCEFIKYGTKDVLIFDGGVYDVIPLQEVKSFPIYLYKGDCKLYDRLNPGEYANYSCQLIEFLGTIDQTFTRKVTGTSFFEVGSTIGNGLKYSTQLSWMDILKCFYIGKYKNPGDTDSYEVKVCLEFINIIAGHGHAVNKIFFECPPINASALYTEPFKFVIKINDNDQQPDNHSTFDEKFRESKWNIGSEGNFQRFPNLGNEPSTLLVVPLDNSSTRKIGNSGTPVVFENIRLFFRTASLDIILQYLHCISLTLYRALIESQDNPLWFSFSGAIPWIHARISTYAKYYTHDPYKDPDQGKKQTVFFGKIGNLHFYSPPDQKLLRDGF